jgi:putative hemolysin
MRSFFFVASSLLILASCTMPWSDAPVAPPKSVEYPTTQTGSPAAAYCKSHGGTVSYDKNPNIPTMEMIYCTTSGSGKVDAWQYMSLTTAGTGVTTTGSIR